MSERLKRYVEKIVNQTECSKEDKEDLFEELYVHVEQLTEDYMREGLSNDEAINRAIAEFGEEHAIGNEIQEAMFPYRKVMMMVLAVLSFATAVTIYLSQLFIEGYAAFVWISLAIGVSTCLLYLSINVSTPLNRRKWVNSLLIFQCLLFVYGWLLATNVAHSISIWLTLLNWVVIAFSLLLIYRTTIIDDFVTNQKKDKKILHAMNITSGIVIIGATLFFLGAFLIMTGTLHFRMVIFLLPFFIWLILYMIQMKLLNHNRVFAYILGAFPLLFALSILGYFFIMPMLA